MLDINVKTIDGQNRSYSVPDNVIYFYLIELKRFFFKFINVFYSYNKQFSLSFNLIKQLFLIKSKNKSIQ